MLFTFSEVLSSCSNDLLSLLVKFLKALLDLVKLFFVGLTIEQAAEALKISPDRLIIFGHTLVRGCIANWPARIPRRELRVELTRNREKCLQSPTAECA